MSYDIKNTIAINLQHLMERSEGMTTQMAVSRRSKVAQTTIGNYLRPDSYKGFPTTANIVKLANAFGIEPWRLLHPQLGANIPTDKELEIYRRVRRAFGTDI